MPIYEFECTSCGGSFDKLVKSMTAIDDISCPSCQSPEVKKKLSLFSSRVSGSSATTTSASCAPGGL